MNQACRPSTRRAGDQESETRSAGRAALIGGSRAVAGCAYAFDHPVAASPSTIAAGGVSSAPEKLAPARSPSTPGAGGGTGAVGAPGVNQVTGAGPWAAVIGGAGRGGTVTPPGGRAPPGAGPPTRPPAGGGAPGRGL